eukprot:4924807-Pyramimonas_sp.AAC.2
MLCHTVFSSVSRPAGGGDDGRGGDVPRGAGDALPAGRVPRLQDGDFLGRQVGVVHGRAVCGRGADPEGHARGVHRAQVRAQALWHRQRQRDSAPERPPPGLRAVHQQGPAGEGHPGEIPLRRMLLPAPRVRTSLLSRLSTSMFVIYALT